MISLMKLDLWLLRWLLLFIVVFVPFAEVFLYTDSSSSMYGVLLVFIMSMSLTQMDEKQKTRRFMLSLPIPLKTFFQSRVFVVVLVGIATIILESIGKILGGGHVTFGELFIEAVTQMAPMVVLAPVTIAMFTLLRHPVVKWGLTFVLYIGIVIVGTVIGLIIADLTYLGATAYWISGAYLLLAVVVSGLILSVANKIRAKSDLV